MVAIAFAYAGGLVRISSSDNTQRVKNVDREPLAVVSQVDGPRWITLEDVARVARDGERVADAVAAFESRYRPASDNPTRVAIEIESTRVLGHA